MYKIKSSYHAYIILMITVIWFSVKLIYKGIIGKATGPYSKELELLWKGEYFRLFGKFIVLGVPIILLVIIDLVL